MKHAYIVAALVSVVIGCPQPGFACSRLSPVSTDDMVRDADAIVRAVAVEYAIPPANPNVYTTGEPASQVRFEIVEIVDGDDVPNEINLPGYLSDRDDFNEHEAPYNFVRPNGRAGNCFANTYRSKAQFLLFLKKRNGSYTVNWYALGPVNEQLRSDRDPWLLWVRDHRKR